MAWREKIMPKLQVYTSKGVKSGELEFPKELMATSNPEFLAQALYVFEDRSHKGSSKVKTRAEVNLSTKKIYRQKGTGGARHGDKKAPIFSGGGVAHGPKGIKRTLNLSKKQNKFALKVVLTQKVKENLVSVVGGIENIAKTKEAANLLTQIAKASGKDSADNALVVLGNDKKDTYKYFRNIKNINLAFLKDLNLRQVDLAKFILVDKDALGGRSETKEAKKLGTNVESTKVAKKKTVKVKKVSIKKK